MRKLLLLLACICMSVSQLIAQNRTVTGKVTDEKGAPIPNATVIIRGARMLGTSTSTDGSFSISVPPAAKSLVVSAINFKPMEMSIGNKGVINFTLENSNNSLDEVVVVGYGTQRKATTTASIVKVGGDKLENRPFTSVDQMLQGASAGLQSSSSTGQPGANQAIRIRGIGSFTYGGAQPLYVVDGVQINGGDLSNGNGVSTTNSGTFNVNPSTNVLATMNANDIESITVLKDAAATSIYGSRGANGVILITTKSGKQGKAQFRLDVEIGNNKAILPPPKGRPLRAKDWLMMLRESYVNGGYTDASITTSLHQYGDTSGIDTDWLGLVTRNGTQQQYNLSATGGEGKIKYYLSGGYFKQEGTTIGTDLKRVTGNTKITYAATNRLTLTTKITVGAVNQNSALASSGTSGGGGYFGNPTYVALTLRPTQTPYNADGTLNVSTVNTGFPSHYNPLYIAAHDKRWLKAFQGMANQSLEYRIIEGLKFTSTMGLQYTTNEEYQFNNPYHGDASGSAGQGIAYYTRNFLYDWVNQFDYHHDLSVLGDQKLSLDAKLGHEGIKNDFFQQVGNVTNFPNYDFYLSTNGATSTNGKVTGSNYTFEGYYGNLLLSLNDKYSLYGSYRRDASSRFSTSDRWGNFASVGASWTLTNEEFMKPLARTLSLLKIRASYGSNGNAEIPNYGWRQLYSFGYNYNGVAGGRFDQIGNEKLTWEKNKQTDIGVDIGLLSNRINITFDYYKRVTKDALLPQNVSPTSGFSSFINNVGDLENKGYEITLNLIPVQTRDVTWEINANLTHNRNRVTSLPAGDQANLQNANFFMRKGLSMYSFYTRGWAGVDPADGAAMWYTDSSRKSTTKTRGTAPLFLVGKQADPKYYGSIGSTVTVKGISLNFDFYYNYGNYIQEAYAQYFLDGTYATRGKYALNLERWQKAGDKTNVPKYVFGLANTSSGSDRLLFKGDYIRLRNVQLAYRITAKSITERLHVNSINVYVRGTNLWTKRYDKNILNDPEQGILGLNQQQVMPSKSFTGGINITF